MAVEQKIIKNKKKYSLKVFSILLMVMVFCGIAESQPLTAKRLAEPVIQELKKDFFLQEAIELMENYGDRARSKRYFDVQKDRFTFIGSEQQGIMEVDAYQVHVQSSMIGVTLFFTGEEQTLVMVNTLINPLAEQRVLNFIKQSLDTDDASGPNPYREAKLYFLGQHPFGPSKVMNIIVRKDILDEGPLYSINYINTETIPEQSINQGGQKQTSMRESVLAAALYIPSAFVCSIIMNFLLGLLEWIGIGAAALPGIGLGWVSHKLGFVPKESSVAKKFNWGMYIFTWAGPIYLISQLLVIALYATGVTLFTGMFIHWFPQAETTLQVLGIIWLWMGIGFSGMIGYVILLWILKFWLGSLGIFWSILGLV